MCNTSGNESSQRLTPNETNSKAWYGVIVGMKSSYVVHKCFNGLAPIYLSFYVTVIVHDYFVVVLRNFSAVASSRLKTYGDKVFFAVAPRLWNQLPPELRSVTSVDQFRTHLKTHLFKLAYDV